ncbi:MAG: hypothetical protein V4616_00570 [Bacteroidota bacterium]
MKTILTFLFITAWWLTGYAQTITNPSGLIVETCKNYTLGWNKFNWNTDRYDLTCYLTGTTDDNNDGVPEPALSRTMWSAQVSESWMWGGVPRSYPFTVGQKWTGTLVFKVEARRRAAGKWKSQGSQIRAYAIATSVVLPPSVHAAFYCDPGNYETKITGDAGTSIRWYHDFTSATAFHTGNIYGAYYPNGLTTHYVSQTRSMNGCNLESVRVPVAKYVFPTTIREISRYGAIQPEPDNRLGQPQCSRSGSFYDLELPINIPAGELGLPPVSLPGLSATFTLAAGDWKDAPYGTTANSYRVCNSHLPAGNGASKTFSRDVKLQMTIELKNPVTGQVLFNASGLCDKPGFVKATVSKDRNCLPNWTDAFNIFKDDLVDCGATAQTISICPGTETRIGPSASMYKNNAFTSYSFEWLSANGISDVNSKNPTIAYNSISLPSGQRYIKYVCRINQSSKLFPQTRNTSYYCVYVYKCPDCVNSDGQLSGEVTLTQSLESEYNEPGFNEGDGALFPNPAVSEIEFNRRFEEEGELRLSILNEGGIQQNSICLDRVDKTHRIDVSTLHPGIYTAVVTCNGKILYSKRFIKE